MLRLDVLDVGVVGVALGGKGGLVSGLEGGRGDLGGRRGEDQKWKSHELVYIEILFICENKTYIHD